MTERKLHPDLENALEKGLPQAYLSPDIVYGALGKRVKDDYKLLGLGVRVSPKAIRTLLLMVSNGFYDEKGYHAHHSPQFRLNAVVYGLFNDFIRNDETAILSKGKMPKENLAQSEKDLYIGPNHHSLGSKVFGTLEEVAIDIERRRRTNPNIKVVLLHGKWNTIPHAGHIFAQHDIEEDLAVSYQIPYEDMVTVIMADTNKDIANSGSKPFLNTLWRVSLLSYSPYCDYVCPSGEFGGKRHQADRHWLHKYKLLRPFAVHVSNDHPHRDTVMKRCIEVGAIPLSYPRSTEYLPRPGIPFHTKVDNVLSSKRVWESESDEISFERSWHYLLATKKIRDDLYGGRRWFGPEEIILPDASRGLIPERVRPLIEGVNLEEFNGGRIIIPPVVSDPRENALQDALASISMI